MNAGRHPKNSARLLAAAPVAPVAVAALAALCGLAGCQQETSHRYEMLDHPLPVPVAQGGVRAKPLMQDVEQVIDPEEAAQCGRGTGRDKDGKCKQLTLRDADYVQRVQIPSGRFVMGDVPVRYDASQSRISPAPRWSATPPRYVDVGTYFIDVAEVSRGAYEACVEEGLCTPAQCPEGTTLPVSKIGRPVDMPQTCVTHAQAEAFCAARGGRLPTEAEWEYAARGPDARVFPWGNEVRDEIPAVIVPIQRTRIDASYFGVLGMGSNAAEWVADEYDARAGIRPYLEAPFERADGPAARARKAFRDKYGIADGARRFVVKINRSAERWAGREKLPSGMKGDGSTPELEAWPIVAQDPIVGFRCVADVTEDDPILMVPEPVAGIPFTAVLGDHEVFGGVVDAVSKAEAEKFCSVLRVPDGDGVATDWRLPTGDEVRALAEVFRGPGPFWTADGAVEQEQAYNAKSDWLDIEVEPGEPLGARCIRDL